MLSNTSGRGSSAKSVLRALACLAVKFGGQSAGNEAGRQMMEGNCSTDATFVLDKM